MMRLLAALCCATGLGWVCQVEAAPALRILAPPDGYVIDADRADVKGAVALHAGTEVAVTVNGVGAVMSGTGFLLDAVPLQPGLNTLSVTATGEDGATTRVITVWSTGKASLTLNANAAGGVAPFAASLYVEDGLSRGIAQLDVDFGDGESAVFDAASLGPRFGHVYQRPGIYTVRVTVTLGDESVAYLQKAIAVVDPEAMEARLKTIWHRFGQALASGDKSEAMGLLTQPAKMKFASVFDALLGQMPEIVQSLSPLQKVSLSPRMGEYAVARSADGESRVFFVQFMLDTDGLWRLEDM